MTHIEGLITPLISTHEPPSNIVGIVMDRWPHGPAKNTGQLQATADGLGLRFWDSILFFSRLCYCLCCICVTFGTFITAFTWLLVLSFAQKLKPLHLKLQPSAMPGFSGLIDLVFLVADALRDSGFSFGFRVSRKGFRICGWARTRHPS